MSNFNDKKKNIQNVAFYLQTANEWNNMFKFSI